MLEKTLESPLDYKDIKPVNPKWNQPWIFIGMSDAKAEAPIPLLPDVKWITETSDYKVKVKNTLDIAWISIILV